MEDIEKRPGIYRILNILTNDSYIGSSNNIYSRLSQHKSRSARRTAKALSIMVIDLETGISYDSIKEASIIFNIPRTTLNARMLKKSYRFQKLNNLDGQ